MRMRGIAAVVAAGMLFAGAAPALAGGNLKVRPNPVKQGKTLLIIARNCVSGSGYTAWVRVSIEVDNDGDDSFRKVTQRRADDGFTVIGIKMKPKRWLPDRYIMTVRCLHVFEDPAGARKTFWKQDKRFRVKR